VHHQPGRAVKLLVVGFILPPEVSVIEWESHLIKMLEGKRETSNRTRQTRVSFLVSPILFFIAHGVHQLADVLGRDFIARACRLVNSFQRLVVLQG
jgi:hypothetical protein